LDTVLIFLSLLGYYFIFIKYFKTSSENTLFFIVSSIIFIFYWLAYFNILFWGAYAILVIGWLGLPLMFYVCCGNKKVLWQQYLTPVFIISLFYIVFLSLLSIGVHVNSVDEFAQWGPHAKFMWLNHGFIRAHDVMMHKAYPPGGSLFYYFFYIMHGFSETRSFIAQQLLFLAAVPVVLRNIRWKEWPVAFVGYSVLLFIFNQFGVRLGLDGSLYMDPITGVFFGTIIACYILSQRRCLNILSLIPAIFAMSLFKLKLMPFIGVITLIVLVDQLWLAIFDYQKNNYLLFGQAVLKNIKLMLARFLSILMLPISALVAIKSWNYYLTLIHTPQEWATHFSNTKVFDLFLGRHLTQRELITLTNFKHALIGPIIFVMAVAILVLLTCFLYRRRKESVAFILNNLVLLAGFVGFLVGLLLMYLFAFGAYEGEGLAAFDRYVVIYYLAWAIVVYAGVFQALLRYKCFKSGKLQYPLMILLILALAFMMIGHFHRMHKPEQMKRSRWHFRQGIQAITNQVKHYTHARDHVFIVWQKSSGYTHRLISYELVPRTTSMGCSSFGAKYKPGDIWTCPWSFHEFTSHLKTYNYLLLAYTDSQFWQTYGALFPQQPPHLKSLVNYHVCMKDTFDGIRDKGCRMETKKAYLFKIIHHNGRTSFENVV